MKSFKMGVRNTLNNWRHSLGSMLSVAIGFAALTLFNGYISVVQDMYEDNYRQRSMFGDVMIEKSRNGKAIDFEDSRINEKEQQFIENFITENRLDSYAIQPGLGTARQASLLTCSLRMQSCSARTLETPSVVCPNATNAYSQKSEATRP